MLVLKAIKRRLQRRCFKKDWRRANSHNYTTVKQVFNADFVHVGKKTYGTVDVLMANVGSHLYIGNYCSIAEEVKFLLCVEHAIDRISTYPFRAYCLNGGPEAESKGDIIVEDDVWIGYGATILSGVHIGQGAVVAAGAVVAKDVPPYAVVGGVPAKVIKYRFEPALVEKLLQIDFSKLDDDLIRANAEKLCKRLEQDTQLAWLPRKSTDK